MAGGREIWGLPKELTQFSWGDEQRRVVVRQGDRRLCVLSYGRQRYDLWLVDPEVITLQADTNGEKREEVDPVCTQAFVVSREEAAGKWCLAQVERLLREADLIPPVCTVGAR